MKAGNSTLQLMGDYISRIISGIVGILMVAGGIFWAIVVWPFSPTGSIIMLVVSCGIVIFGFELVWYAIRGTRHKMRTD